MNRPLAATVIALLATAFTLPVVSTQAEAGTACTTLSLTCASVLGSVTDSTHNGCCPNPHQDTLVHCEGTHTSDLSATGRCYVEGSQVDSCSIGTIGGACTSHGHTLYHNTVSGQCWTVKATTTSSAGAPSDSHKACT